MVVRDGRTLRHAVPRHRATRSRPAASRGCCRSPSRPTTRAAAVLRLLHRRGRRPAHRRVPPRATPTAPIPAPPGSCCGWPTRSPTTTAGCCCSAPTTCSTSAPATAAAAATSTARAATRRTSARCSARSCASTRARPAGAPTRSRRDNPFVGRSGARGEIYAYGLRNPWRFSFDRETRRPHHRRRRPERVGGDRLRRGAARAAGANFGWRPFEGRARYTPGESAPGHVAAGDRALARATATARSPAASSCATRRCAGLRGRYVFGDFCNGRIESARLSPGAARAACATRRCGSTASPRSARTPRAASTRLARRPGLPDRRRAERDGRRCSSGRPTRRRSR